MNRFCYLALMVAAGCNSPSTAPEASTLPAAPATKPAATVPADTAGPARTARRFVSWYATHQKELSNGLVLNDDGLDSTKFYSVDFPDTENWLRKVAGSGTVSPAYLDGWRAYFRSYDDTLRLHPQNDGPPAGFDHDLLMLSQEPDTKVADLQVGTVTVTSRQGNRAQVQARGPRHEAWQEGLNFEMSRSADGRWLIDRIDNGSDAF
ncbi:hypothetical protein [Hymenobacter lucidus]|uniref:DUF3828 domain-containing protein n=1 Tax=Hymenobacter lucidus TaxID=2880930 RepID=A0ABS8ATB7_9BACT|nr:hypothetical protein [Hymenobacter lucidus]MCB2407961.1 hypothetical protein [Hymenobacter lucidus]